MFAVNLQQYLQQANHFGKGMQLHFSNLQCMQKNGIWEVLALAAILACTFEMIFQVQKALLLFKARETFFRMQTVLPVLIKRPQFHAENSCSSRRVMFVNKPLKWGIPSDNGRSCKPRPIRTASRLVYGICRELTSVYSPFVFIRPMIRLGLHISLCLSTTIEHIRNTCLR